MAEDSPHSEESDNFNGIYLEEDVNLEVINFDNDQEPDDSHVNNSTGKDILSLKYKIKMDDNALLCCLDVAYILSRYVLVVGGMNDIIYILNFSDGSLLKRLDTHKDTVTSLCFHKTKPILLSADLSGIILLWNFNDPEFKMIQKIETDSLEWVEWFDDKSLIIVCGMSSGGLQLWHCQTEQYRSLVGVADLGYHVPYLKCGTIDDYKIIYGNEDGTFMVWGINERKMLSTINYNRYGPVAYLELSQNKSLIFCSFHNIPVIAVISSTDYREIFILEDRSIISCNGIFKLISTNFGLLSVCEVPNSDEVESVIALWDVSSRRIIATVLLDNIIIDISLCSLNTFAVAFNDGHFDYRTLPSLDLLSEFNICDEPIELMKYIPEPSHLVLASSSGFLSVYSYEKSS